MITIKPIKNYIRHKVFPFAAGILKLNMRSYYSIWYLIVRKRLPDLKHPGDFSEIMISRMLQPAWKEYARFVDKILVRDYVAERGLKGILTELYGTYNNADEIDFSRLPERFVLKTNHGCGHHIFCHAKEQLDIPATVQFLNTQLRSRYNNRYEPQYVNVIPRILAEEYLDDGNGKVPVDYKFQCIHGQPRYVFVGTERDKKVRYTIFDLEWHPLGFIKNPYLPSVLPGQPKNLPAMRKAAEILSQGFPFVRIDLYDLGNRIVFGEMTFSPGSGIVESHTDEAIEIIGQWITSPQN